VKFTTNAVGIEAEIELREPIEAEAEDHCPGEQNHRQGGFTGDEPLAHTPAGP
jgi:hypothetical protein